MTNFTDFFEGYVVLFWPSHIPFSTIQSGVILMIISRVHVVRARHWALTFVKYSGLWGSNVLGQGAAYCHIRGTYWMKRCGGVKPVSGRLFPAFLLQSARNLINLHAEKGKIFSHYPACEQHTCKLPVTFFFCRDSARPLRLQTSVCLG